MLRRIVKFQEVLNMKITLKVIYFSLGLCAGFFILAACTPTASQQGGEDNLTGQGWNLSLLMDKELVTGSSITALFTSAGKVGGSSGCNQYSGAYKTSGSKIEITSPLASTMMACAQALMDQESAYLKALGEIQTFNVTGDTLILSGADNKRLLVFKAQSQDLAGTSWEVIGYNNGKQAVTSVLAGTTLTAEFGKNGSLSGNSGCNTYNGTYTVTGDQIKIGPLATTRMACPQEIMDQETQYLAALQTAATYRVEGTGLDLRTQEGALAVDFQVKPSASTVPTQENVNSIQDIIWQWVSVTNKTTGETTTVPDPENYTITFHVDGTLDGKADCNNFTGTYSQENGFTITLGASTMAFCGEASLDQQYLTLLGSVVAGGPDGAGGLALENAGGEQRMLFKNGGAVTQ
jgi:heat shock protein HslJ